MTFVAAHHFLRSAKSPDRTELVCAQILSSSLLRVELVDLGPDLQTQHHCSPQLLLINSLIMSGKFEPKVPVQLDPPKDDPISVAELSKANGKSPSDVANPANELRELDCHHVQAVLKLHGAD